MGNFQDPLHLLYIDELDLWRTDREFTYFVTPEDPETVPEGFLTDLASIPRPFWIILPPTGKYNQCAVLHDWLYSLQKRTRKEADDIFLEAMKVKNVPSVTRAIMHRAVRMFGWIPWNHHRAKLMKGEQHGYNANS